MTSTTDGVRVSESDTHIDLGAHAHAISQKKKSCCATCCGFVWSDWSQVVGRIGVVGGIGAAGVGIYIQQPWTVVAGVSAVFLAYLFPDIRISCMKPKKKFEDNVNRIQDENNRLNSEVGELNQKVADLDKIIEDLKETLQEANKAVADLKAANEDNIDLLNAGIKKLSQIREQLEVLKKLYTDLKNYAGQFANDLVNYNKMNELFKENVSGLDTKSKMIQKTTKDLSQELEDAEDMDSFYKKHNAELNALIGTMTTNVGSLQTEFEAMKNGLQALTDQVTALDLDKTDFANSTKALQEQVIPQLQALLKSFSEINDNKIDPKPIDGSVGGDELYDALLKEKNSQIPSATTTISTTSTTTVSTISNPSTAEIKVKKKTKKKKIDT